MKGAIIKFRIEPNEWQAARYTMCTSEQLGAVGDNSKQADWQTIEAEYEGADGAEVRDFAQRAIKLLESVDVRSKEKIGLELHQQVQRKDEEEVR